MNRLARIVDALDQVSPSWLLAMNGLLALFVLVAHGGWLLLTRTGTDAADASDLTTAYLSIPIAAAALLLAAGGFAFPSLRLWALRAQAVALLLLVLFLLVVAWRIIADGVPASGRFSWDPVLFAFLFSYPVYLARRVLFPQASEQQVIPHYSHVFALFISLAISVLVLYRAAP